MARMQRGVRSSRNGVEFISNIDRTQYTMKRLQAAALTEIGSYIRKKMIAKAKLQRNMKRSKRIAASFQYWRRKRENDLQIGIKHNTWYGVNQELGTRNHPKKAILMNTVFENVDDIRRIAGIYIAAIEDENKAAGLINEDGSW
ncbi:HK97-gp10 family putative phage morphogenesis protein [Paenibacillus sp. FSL P4-0081]|uniref:HK97-gp10 family putative phage morphogenesis protein n=1 Tax=Paenibacillus sp. FSL P4-0081 TaxID=1536769 RepID=UPI0012E0BA88|nr:HK97-gp10 family putative phage morphogenesis protein [Paenibacillus sp. FSL P4-0081]